MLPAVRMNGDQERPRYNCSVAVFQSMRARFFGAMHTAIDLAAGFDAVAYDLAITMRPGRRQHMNRALEAVKRSSLSRRRNLK